MVLLVEAYHTSMLGELLLSERTEASLSVEELSSSTGLSPSRIEAVEMGRHDLDDAELERLLTAYDVAPRTGRFTDLVVEVDLDRGSASMKKVRRRANERPAADSNLLSYLSMVYEDRELSLGSEIPIRSIDLSLLRPALAIRRPEVELHLDRLTEGIPDVAMRNKSILGVALGVGVAVAAGAIILIPSSTAGGAQDTEPSQEQAESVNQTPATQVDPRLEIGSAMVIERSAPPVATVQVADGSAGPATPTIQIGTAQVIERTIEEAQDGEAAQIADPATSDG